MGKKEIEEIDVKLRLINRNPLHTDRKQVCACASYSYIKLFKCLIYDFCIVLYETK